MPRWMINCEEHSRLASQDLDGPLSFWDWLSARMHRLFCPPCRQFRKQLDAIRSACRDGWDDIDEGQTSGATLSEDACRKLESAIRDRLKR
jgi:hypothetical protein